MQACGSVPTVTVLCSLAPRAARALLKLTLFCFCVLEQIGDEIIEELGDHREALVRTRDRVRTGCLGFFYHAALYADYFNGLFEQVPLFIHPILPIIRMSNI